jgi:hypothetical protein
MRTLDLYCLQGRFQCTNEKDFHYEPHTQKSKINTKAIRNVAIINGGLSFKPVHQLKHQRHDNVMH